MVINQEATQLIEQELSAFRDESYGDLVRRISKGSLDYERTTPSGTTYQIEVQFFWDDRPGGNIRVMGSIDGGGLSASFPLNRDFVKSADGSFVGD